MSILINGMEMPKRQILAVINPNGLVEVLAGNTLIAEFEAVPVPPHGDLIDRDALEEHDGWIRDSKYFSEQSRHTHIQFVFTNDIIDAPTIIPADKEGAK